MRRLGRTISSLQTNYMRRDLRIILKMYVIVIFVSCLTFAQQSDYWKNAPTNGIKIYSICFPDQQNGFAISSDSTKFITNDAGNNWVVDPDSAYKACISEKSPIWSADIYCSVMYTTDGGLNWNAYVKEAQEHFCGVYFKDQNSGYKIASEFLGKVSLSVNTSLAKNEFAKLISEPQMCAEYFTNEAEGWAAGWCLHNLKILKNNKEEIIK